MTSPLGPDGVAELGEEGHVRNRIKPNIALLLQSFENGTHVDGTPIRGANLQTFGDGDRTFYRYAQLSHGNEVKAKRPVDAL